MQEFPPDTGAAASGPTQPNDARSVNRLDHRDRPDRRVGARSGHRPTSRWSRVLRGIWIAIDTARRATLNAIFIAIVAALVFVVCAPTGPEVHDTAAVVIRPGSVIVEEPSRSAMSRVNRTSGSRESVLRDIIAAIDVAKDDQRIRVMVLDLSKLAQAGLSKLEEIAAAIDAFKAKDKRVIATAAQYGQAAYFLAAHADEVHVHPMGEVALEGYARYRRYYKDLLDRLALTWHVFRVGKYKSAVEPYLRNDMSPEAREMTVAWMGDHWQRYIEIVARVRGLQAVDVGDFAQHYERHMRQHEGDGAKAALATGLVDHVSTADEVRARVIELVGEDSETHSFHQVSGRALVAAHRQERPPAEGPRVGIIVARGLILDGSQPSGNIGGDSTAALIRRARHDDDIKAIVLRVDSPGGSAYASEVIRRELELARQDGKVVVVSMSSVAASGGYWISMAADEVWAHASTVTGSIGIYAMIPTAHSTLGTMAGIHVDGLETAPRAGVRVDRALDPRMAEVLERVTQRGYQRFLHLVSSARNMTVAEVDALAQGRVWSGADAHEHGLVDHLGGLTQAVAAAAERAGLPADVRATYLEPELSFSERLMQDLLQGVGGALASYIGQSLSHNLFNAPLQVPNDTELARSTMDIADAGVVQAQRTTGWPSWPSYLGLMRLMEPMSMLAAADDPLKIYAHAMLDVD